MIEPSEVARPRRGEVWWAELPGDKIRPVVVMHRSSACRFLNSVLVAPVFSKIRGIPTEVVLGSVDGLPKVCAANVDSLVLVSRERLRRRQTRLSEGRMRQLCVALEFAVGCDGGGAAFS